VLAALRSLRVARHATRRTPCQRPFWEERISCLFMK